MGRNGKKGANQHNSKHESGIVAPGRRVTKQRSNSHLGNGSTDNSNGNAATGIAKDAGNSIVSTSPVPHSSIQRSLSHQSQSYSTSDDLEELDTVPGMAVEPQHRRIDVTAAKKHAVNDGGGLHLAPTVLKSYTMADTVAILVFLLSLPPVVLVATNGLFTMLTLFPYISSFATLPGLSDFTSSISAGAPSFLVMVFIDLIAICIWSVIPWPHIQTIVLDCAEATVATTLGGGYRFKPGSSDNLVMVMSIVAFTHIGRYRRVILKWLHRTSLTRYLPLIGSLDDLPAKSMYHLSSDRSWYTTLRTYLAIHILVQGLTRMVRRALNTNRDSSLTTRNIDPEANNNSTSFENVEAHSPSLPLPLKSKTSLQNLRDTSDKVSSGKRRRKQANYARSQQPLWAALAAMKVKRVVEREQSQDVIAAQSSDTHGFGNAPFMKEENRIWITTLLPDKIYFETGPIDCTATQDSHDVANEAGLDLSLPIIVRVNGATWASVDAQPIQAEDRVYGGMRWVGRIYGLTAANSYRVSFVRDKDDVELYSVVIVTPSSPVTEQTTSASSLPVKAPRPASPASPIVTFKTSIASFEASISEILASQKRVRNDSKASKKRIERETEGLNEKLARGSTGIKNFNHRYPFLENCIKQTEDAIAALEEQLKDEDFTMEDFTKEWQEHKSNWENIRNELSRVQEDVQRTKEEYRSSLTAAQTRELSERQKRDRAQTRVKKLSTDFTNLHGPAKSADRNRANSTYAKRAVELDQKEAQAQFQYEVMRNANHELFREAQIIKNEVDHLEHIAYQNDVYFTTQNQPRLAAQDSRPITPEGILPGTNPQAPGSNQSASFSRPHLFSTPEQSHAVPASTGKTFTNGFAHRHNSISARHRSQSALSGTSVHIENDNEEDDDDEDPIPVMHKRRTGITGVTGVREGSDGRSSGSGSPHVSAGPIPPPAIGSERRHSPATATGAS